MFVTVPSGTLYLIEMEEEYIHRWLGLVSGAGRLIFIGGGGAAE
jgi:hypothetical protein